MIFDELMKAKPDAPTWITDHQPIVGGVTGDKIHPTRIADMTARAATVLSAHGVHAGDRVVVWVESPIDTLVAFVAATAIDAVPILISPTWSGDVLAQMLEGVSGVTAVVADSERVAESRMRFASLNTLDWAEVAQQLPLSRRFSRVRESAGEHSYVVVHTSGTTGVPKLVDCSARSVAFNALFQVVTHWMAGIRGYCAVAVSPVHGRTVVGLYAALIRRLPLMILGEYSPQVVDRMVRAYRPEFLETHPNHFRAWQHLAAQGTFESVRIFGTGFDVVHPDTVQALFAGSKHRRALYFEIYGQNESGPVAIRMHVKGLHRLRRRKGVSAGHPVGIKIPFVGVRIVDERGVPVPRGTTGHLLVRSRGVFSGYINRRDITSRNYPENRWWDTGDLARRSRLGSITLVDRDSEKLTGALSAIAIEDVLLQRLPDLLEAVVLDIGDVLIPVLSIRPETTFDRGRWHEITGDLVPLAEPVLIDDADFPRTVTGKVRRKVLQEAYIDGAFAAEVSHAS